MVIKKQLSTNCQRIDSIILNRKRSDSVNTLKTRPFFLIPAQGQYLCLEARAHPVGH